MAKLLIDNASKKYGISNSRILHLIQAGVIGGEKVYPIKDNKSWVYEAQIKQYIKNRTIGRPCVKNQNDWVSVSTASDITQYSISQIGHVINTNQAEHRDTAHGVQISLLSLKKYIKSKENHRK